ncbi:MAG: nickel-dependent lactate racemase [bacterium]|nr:MAG: nickel-dependent lactate racemase [bacterium]
MSGTGTFSLPYERGSVDVMLPDRYSVRVIGTRMPEPVPDAAEALRRAVDHPVQSPPLAAMIPPQGRISVLVPDRTRGTSATDLLRPLLSLMEALGCGPDRVEIVLANGMHRAMEQWELDDHMGGEIAARWTVLQHDARDTDSLHRVGSTHAGTPVLFNTRVLDSVLVIVLGSVSFHYFAGFGGGRKLLLPGIAGEETILANHRLSLKADPGSGLADGCRSATLEGNPVHEDMLDAAGLVHTPLFCINVVADGSGSAVFINAGDLGTSHRRACRFLWDHCHVPIEHPYPVVISSAGGDPKDINLVQGHKALRHASNALVPGGLMLMAVSCPDGIGSASYAQSFSEGLERVPDVVRGGYTLNSQTALSTYGLVRRFRIRLMTRLGGDDVARLGFSCWRREETSAILDAETPSEILVIPNASNLIPIILE